MATLAEKIRAEKRMRDLLEQSGLPQPDHVEYGFTCIRLFFMESKTVVVVDIDQPEEDIDEPEEDIDEPEDDIDEPEDNIDEPEDATAA